MPCKILLTLLLAQIALATSLFSQTNEQLRANLYAYNANEMLSLNDGNLTVYDNNNSNSIDGMDAVKMTNFGENLGLLRGNTTLAIERRQSINISDTIFFRMWNMHKKNYKLELSSTGLSRPGLTAVLKDKYLNTSTALDLNGISSATFTVTSDAQSSTPDRFSIIFSTATYFKPLPVTFTGIKAYQVNNDINIEWTVENANGISLYEIQKSADGRKFLPIGSIPLKSANIRSYVWSDIAQTNGIYFYRIASVDISNKIQYSAIARASTQPGKEFVSIYPNPVISKIINVQVAKPQKGMYTYKLISSFGEVIQSLNRLNNDGSNTQTLEVNKTIPGGNYILEITSPEKIKMSRQIIIP